MTTLHDLRSLLRLLTREREIVNVDTPVDPRLELAEIHRRVIAEGGPALLFKQVKGSSFPVVTNLFGTKRRVDLAFGTEGQRFVETAAALPHELMPPSIGKLWQKRAFFQRLAKVGLRKVGSAPVLEKVQSPANLESLPVTTTWPVDGGPFFTLPLVYTEHPETHVHNLGIYRMQRYSANAAGMHMQIGKGGGFHLAAAKERGEKLPVNVFLGGPPAAIIGAIAPLPENVPELLLTSLLAGGKVRMADAPRMLSANSGRTLPLLADAEFVLVGEVDPTESLPEGPFGDHYGYYSLIHDFPVFRCRAVCHRKDAIFPATVVGKLHQEDYFIGNYLQELLSPLFPVVMPSVKQLWSYGETGFHSLAAAVVRERYKREALMSGFRILGEGQLSLTKFLILIDKEIDLKDFRKVLTYLLERIDFRSDLYIFSNTSMDTLDYTGPKLNEGSKGIMIGIGEPRRELSREFRGSLGTAVKDLVVFSPGCLVVSGPSFENNPTFSEELALVPALHEWPLIVLCDDAKLTCSSETEFLWSVFTRFEPARDIYARSVKMHRFHPELSAPIIIDARLKPGFPDEVVVDDETRKLVDRRWGEYFPLSSSP